MSEKPAWVRNLEAERCECVPCADCKGSGVVHFDWRGHFVKSNMTDCTDELDTCFTCDGSGIVEDCDRCILLNDYDAEIR